MSLSAPSRSRNFPSPATAAQRVSLHQLVGGLARHALAHQRQHHRLAEVEPPRLLQVLAHAGGVDDQAVDQPGGAADHEVGQAGRVGADHPLDRRVRDVALVPERDVLQRGVRVRPQQARDAAQVLGQDRVLLVRHRRRALLPLAERLRRLADLGALPVADGDRQPLDRRAQPRQRQEVGGVAIARDHLRRHDLAAAGRATRAPPARRRAPGWRRCRPRRRSCRPRSPARAATSAALRAPELGVPAREDQARGDRLGVDAVRAADRRRSRGARRPGGGRRRAAGRRPPGSDRPPRPAGSRTTRPARPTTSCRGAASAPARPPAPRRASGTR